MLEGILAFLISLPKVLTIMDRVGRLILDHDLNKWLDDLERTIDTLEQAKTPDEKLNAAKKLALSIRSLK